jgi:hypothetical protein
VSITIQCPQCGKRYSVPETAAGKVATCQGCGVKMRIPGAQPPPAPEPEPEPEPEAAGALPTEMRANRSIAGRTCPVCAATIELGQEVRNCELCGETHHAACWTEHNGCGTDGCDNAPLPQLGFAPEDQAPPPQQEAPQADTKSCPFCGERIAKAATKCRFCNEYLDESKGKPRFTRKSDTARNALICGIISIFCCGIILGPIAIVLALNAKKEIAGSRGAVTGEGMATAGMITGIIGTIGAILIIVLRIVAASNSF